MDVSHPVSRNRKTYFPDITGSLHIFPVYRNFKSHFPDIPSKKLANPASRKRPTWPPYDVLKILSIEFWYSNTNSKCPPNSKPMEYMLILKTFKNTHERIQSFAFSVFAIFNIEVTMDYGYDCILLSFVSTASLGNLALWKVTRETLSKVIFRYID